jgi:hypothetical protein
MRHFLVLIALVITTPTFADPADSNPPPKAKGTEPIKYGPIIVDGHREVPVAVVLTRDQTVKQELDKTTDEHVRDAATRQ